MATDPVRRNDVIPCCAARIGSVWHAKALAREYSAYSRVSHAIERNYGSGFSAVGDEMTYDVPPNRGVLAFAEIKPGTYTLASEEAEYPAYILRYFHKRVLVVRQPPQ